MAKVTICLSNEELAIIDTIRSEIIPRCGLDLKSRSQITSTQTNAFRIALLICGRVLERQTDRDLLDLRYCTAVPDTADKLVQSMDQKTDQKKELTFREKLRAIREKQTGMDVRG